MLVLTMFAVAIGSLSQAQAALASQRLPARAASASHAGTPASIATRAVRAAAATRQMAPRTRLRTQEKQGSLPLGRDQRATETPSAPQLTSAASLAAPKITSVGLPVGQACQITRSGSTTFIVGQPGTFTVTTTGLPHVQLSVVGPLPPGVTFTDNGDGTATIREHRLRNRRHVPVHDHRHERCQSCRHPELHPHGQPGGRDHQPAGATFTAGQAGTFTVTTTGYPNSTLSETGALPSGVTFTDNGDGAATLAGTPAANTAGTYPFTITATNGVSPDATQTFTLTVNQAPGITSADHTTCTAGKACAFTVKSTGAPTPGLSEKGALPRGVRFKDNRDGTATLSGAPAAGTGGTYPFRITATNGVSPDATQSFTLTVVGPPAAPSGLKATGRGKTVSLTWKNNASAPSAATAIQIQRSTNAGFTTAVTNTTVGPAVTTHIDKAVVKGKKYYYRVRAHNAVGNSAWSNVSNVTAP